MLEGPFELIIDSTKTIEELVTAGHYDMSSNQANSRHFVSTQSNQTTLSLTCRLIGFDRLVSTNEAVAMMVEMKVRPANIVELLTFGILYPKVQLQNPIVALGMLPDWHYDHKLTPYLDSWEGERKLSVDGYVGLWHKGYKFLVIEYQ